MASTAKRYRIEESFRTEFAPIRDRASDPAADEPLGKILETVLELKQFLDPSQRLASDVVDAYRREISEVYQLRNELDAMKNAISSTKLEIASLYRSDHEGKGMRRVAGELDAVVGATEEATTTILNAVEEIESQASMMKSAGVETGNNDCVGAILERVVVMYEACNFQDLTGQRISKIVSVLKFVEERLDRMIGVWGGLEAFKDLAGHPGAAPIDEDAALLNGPKLEDDLGHVDQTDIDALFD
jgi:chemotaxis protein CheZ